MSVSKWRYTEECNGRPCPGDCDYCSFEPGDSISRADAIEMAVDVETPQGTYERAIYVDDLMALPSADAVPLCDDCTKCTVKALNRPSAESEDRLYIKIYADDEPSVKAEKLYQICGETQNREVTKWLKEYFPSADAVHGEWIWRTDIPIGDGRTSAGYICSNCGKDYWHGNVFNYCPSCGARMKGGDDE